MHLVFAAGFAGAGMTPCCREIVLAIAWKKGRENTGEGDSERNNMQGDSIPFILPQAEWDPLRNHSS